MQIVKWNKDLKLLLLLDTLRVDGLSLCRTFDDRDG